MCVLSLLVAAVNSADASDSDLPSWNASLGQQAKSMHGSSTQKFLDHSGTTMV